VRQRLWWVALGVGAYLAFTLASFPAATAYRWFAPRELALAGVEGTLWSGRAAAGAVANVAVQDIRWTLRPWMLLLGRVAAEGEARLADGFVSTHVTATPSRLELADLRASTSLTTLSRALPISGARGLANLSLDRLVLENGRPSAVAGKLRVQQLEVVPFISMGRQAQLLPLGDYDVVLGDDQNGKLVATIKDAGGPLEVGGTVTFDAARKYVIDALIKPRDGANADLVQGLNAMTPEPDTAGRRHLQLEGSL